MDTSQITVQQATQHLEQTINDFVALLPPSARPGTQALGLTCLGLLTSRPAEPAIPFPTPAAPPAEQ